MHTFPSEIRSRWAQRLHALPRERAMAFALALALELALLAILLTLGMARREEPAPLASSLTTFDVSPPSAQPQADQAAPQTDSAAPADDAALPVPDRPAALPPLPSFRQVPAPPAPQPVEQPQPQATAPPAPDRPRAVIREGADYGPPASAARRSDDSEVVGTAPDGSPLYAARWYREPTDQELRGYLSAVDPPAWALIACRTAPGWAVVDCVPLSQSSPSSNIMNAVLAAAWQFQVRPARRGGRSLVGSWVRIRISYTDQAG